MQYREIVAVTGLGGLFQLLASKQDGAIVRSLEDKSTRFVSSRVHNFTPLESIEVFTTGDNVNLSAVFKAMQEQEAKFPPADAKADNNAVKAYFKSVFPEFDEERVYVSDMKKMVKWYAILKVNDLLKFEEEETEAATEAEAAAPAEEEKPKAKATKAKAKKEETATEEAPASEEKSAPKKKAPAKKAAATEEDAEKKPKAAAKKKKTEE